MRVNGAGGTGIEVFLDGPADGVPVLLMHGWPDDHSLWSELVPALTAAGFRTIAPDLRGFGVSDMPEATAAYRIEHTVTDMVAVLDACDARAAHVVAHDWGAAAAWALAATAPTRVLRLVAMSVGHPTAFAAAGLEQRMRSWYMLLFNFEGVAELWLEKFGRVMLAGHPRRDEVLARWQDRRALTAGLQWYRANAHPRAWVGEGPRLPSVTCPVLGLWSSRDPALTEAQMTGSMEFVDGPWRYRRIDGVGHWMMLEAPDVVNAAVLEFLR